MHHKDSEGFSPGIGPTDELSLRVSVATLVRVLFQNPKDGELMLALERKATLLGKERGDFVEIKAQPFGGAIQFRDLRTLQNLIGDFHFDSEPSHSEWDFRIFIRPSAWETVQQFCLEHFRHANDLVLESDPRRELAEEFADTLRISLKVEQFSSEPMGMVVEDHSSPAKNFYARGHLTTRIYRIFETHILDPALISAMLKNSEHYSRDDLRELALEDAQNGGKGWANAVLTLPLNQISALYLATPPEARDGPVSFEDHQLDETVAAVLEGIPVPKYRRL